MTDRVLDYIKTYDLVYDDRDGFYHYNEHIWDEDEIEVLAEFNIYPDTDMNVLALADETDIERVESFINGVDQMYYYVCYLINKIEGLDEKIALELRADISIIQMDYTDFADKVKGKIIEEYING